MDTLEKKLKTNFELNFFIKKEDFMKSNKKIEKKSENKLNVVMPQNPLIKKMDLKFADIGQITKKLFAAAAICAITGSTANAQVEIINNGNVGIGTTTVSNTQGWGRVLDVYNSNNSKLLVRSNAVKVGLFAHNSWNGTVGVVGTESNHDLRLMTNYNHIMTLKTNGNVGIGTTSPAFKLDVNGEGRFGTDNGVLGNGDVIIGTYAYTPPPDPYTYPLTIYSPAIYSDNNSFWGLYLGTPDSWAWRTYSSDVICNNLYNLSDMRLKENIRLCDTVLFKLKNVQSYNYNFKNDFNGLDTTQRQKAQKTEYGFLAQELQTIFPELVNDEDTNKLSVNYIGMIPILTAAINELQKKMDTKIEELTLYIAELERRIAELEAKKGGE